MGTLWYAVGFVLALVLYVRHNDSKLLRIPPEAISLSPERWTDEDIDQTYKRLADAPPSLLKDRLPPKTGRRYIVTGGAGFLGGWIVLHLLARGEDPRRIRVIDIRPPRRKDLTAGAGKDVDFIQADLTNAQSTLDAFSKPWPPAPSDVPGEAEPEVTVFHTAANIRFYERHLTFLSLSTDVNVSGTRIVLDAARRIGASTLVYTASGSIAVHSTRLFLWPWEKEPSGFTQLINDDPALLPTRHGDYFSNYAISKHEAEKLVLAADKTSSGTGLLRTGAIRPGNGVYGPGGDILLGLYLITKTVPTWISPVIQSFIFVENCSLSHLCYEARLIEAQRGTAAVDVGGQAFNVADAGPAPTYGDAYRGLTRLTNGETIFREVPPTVMFAIAHMVEAYYLARHFLLQSPLAFVGRLLPALKGDIVMLQPSLFYLTSIHLIFDDSRARLAPEKGGLGYNGDITTLEGLCKLVAEHNKGDAGAARMVLQLDGYDHGFGLARPQHAVEEIIEKVESGVDIIRKRH
ncbi:NAD(P)-binding protein [Wolfiporia cocos MD-104 SS10]|uniref:NAD(P)-binding protein n=1 Tax=Wolfiporia cocos (strain MD-104) TaxID=742152 RepID=A0A2H3K3W5_WOLCO|nr:NAD(P)-binding protein [Wolfiporia cocos MD-104 SS10]